MKSLYNKPKGYVNLISGFGSNRLPRPIPQLAVAYFTHTVDGKYARTSKQGCQERTGSMEIVVIAK